MELMEKQLTTALQYHGVIVDVCVDDVELPNGHRSVREVVSHPGGVAILPMTDEGDVLLVRQYRYPVGKVLLEVPAGKLEKGEEHHPAALRELEEEVGAVPEKMEYLGGMYVSPGFCTETIHLYLATGLKQGTAHPDEDEFLNVERVPFETLVDMVMAGEVEDAKTVAVVLKTKLLKERRERT